MELIISLTLDPEQAASLQSRCAERDPVSTPEAYLTRSLNAEIASYVEADFNAAAQRRIEAAKGLPLPDRLAILESIDQAISNAAT